MSTFILYPLQQFSWGLWESELLVYYGGQECWLHTFRGPGFRSQHPYNKLGILHVTVIQALRVEQREGHHWSLLTSNLSDKMRFFRFKERPISKEQVESHRGDTRCSLLASMCAQRYVCTCVHKYSHTHSHTDRHTINLQQAQYRKIKRKLESMHIMM